MLDFSDPDSLEWRARLRRAVAQVRTWEPATQEMPTVHPSSALAGDDAQQRRHPVSQFAWIGISIAVEHLSLACDDVDRALNGLGGLRPFAPFTVTRSALMGASQAVWLLAPDDSATRVRRTLSVAWEEQQQYGKFLSDYADDPSIEQDVSPEAYQNLHAVHAAVLEDRKAIEKTLGGGAKSMTTIMKEAAEHLTAREADSWQLRAVQWEWRLSSAAAHARFWPFRVRHTERTPLADRSGEVYRLTTNWRECTQAVGAATLMVNEAVRLWNVRSRRPNAGAAFGITPNNG